MNEQDKLELLRQWKAGTISSTDKRNLELEALDDDFLFDSMEGFRISKEKNHDSTPLSERLAERIQSNSSQSGAVVKRMWSPRRIAGIAASLLVVASLFWWMNSNPIPESTVADIPGPTLEENKLKKQDLIEENEAEESTEFAMVSDETTKEKTVPVEKSKPNKSATASVEKPSKSQESIKDFMAQESLNSRAGASDTEQGNQIEVDEEFLGIHVGDLNYENHIGETPPAVKEETIEDAVIVDMSEVTVAEESITPASKAPTTATNQAPQADRMARKKTTVLDRVETEDFGNIKYQFAPEKGWEKFDDYIEKNREYPATVLKQGLTQKVVVDFLIDSKGFPTDVKIIESTAVALNDNAMKLIRFGGKWKTNDHTKRVQYVIKY